MVQRYSFGKSTAHFPIKYGIETKYSYYRVVEEFVQSSIKKIKLLFSLLLLDAKNLKNIGMSCFRQPNLLGVLFSAPSAGKKAKAVQGKNLTIGSSRKRHRKEDAAGIFYTLSSHQIEAPIFLLCHNMSISTVHFIYETEICPLV